MAGQSLSAFGTGDLDVVHLLSPEVEAHMDPEIRALTTQDTGGGGIDNTQPTSSGLGLESIDPLCELAPQQELKPRSPFPQALEQRHVRQLSQLLSLRPRGRCPQRPAAQAIGQSQAQQCLRIADPAPALQTAQIAYTMCAIT